LGLRARSIRLPVASFAGRLKTHDVDTALGNIPGRVDVRRNMPVSLKQAGSRQGVKRWAGSPWPGTREKLGGTSADNAKSP